MSTPKLHLNKNVDNNNEGRVDQRKEEPHLHRFDLSGGGQAGGHRQVDGGQHHHAGDIDCDDQLILVLGGDVVGGLVNDVHQESRQVGHKNYVTDLAGKINCVNNSNIVLCFTAIIYWFI